MQIYLPIAELSLNVFLLLGMGGLVGFLSGMFGVGGGFLMTPLLLFAGVPSAVAVASGANEITAASISGAQAHWRRGGVDVKMGLVLSAGGLVGSYAGAIAFKILRATGQLELMISVAFVIFLTSMGLLMLVESGRTIWRQHKGLPVAPRRRHRTWVDSWPHKMRFRKSLQYVSVYLPLMIGAVVGIMVSLMGVGGGFIMIPAMIYILNMPTNVVIGTSLFQITVVTGAVTFFHSINTQSVDVVLALILLVGAVIGAQLGVRVGYKLRGEQLRGLLGLMVFCVGLRMGFDLFVTPQDFFSVTPVLG
ncbi:sulfite exporter TauE/SafE family protein [Govanella unica]|uniref:Probable membrane transporter protein n=1 Tax=Govanella unica TaxID=2975056 RepID=A0A9X3TVI9_9PROT|nr:sulfite exporter TauE/SafE family protein [Govania unica]MDA5192477.1 sulfite exporter TauE/SafE family protein [Govania unica]